jgi:hypothetical protein
MRLKRPWSYGRAYIVMIGIVFLVLGSLAAVHLHLLFQNRLKEPQEGTETRIKKA